MGHYRSLLILLRLKVTSYDALLVCYRNSNKVFGQKKWPFSVGNLNYKTISMTNLSKIDINQKKFGVKMSKVKVKTNNKEDRALEVILPVTVSTLTVHFTVTDIFLFIYCIIEELTRLRGKSITSGIFNCMKMAPFQTQN